MIAATAAAPNAAPKAPPGEAGTGTGAAPGPGFASLLAGQGAAATPPAAGSAAATSATAAPAPSEAPTTASGAMPVNPAAPPEPARADPAVPADPASAPAPGTAVAEARPRLLVGKTACRAPTPMALRAGETSEPAAAEPVTLSAALPAPAAACQTEAGSAAPGSDDPASTLLLQIHSPWALPPIPTPPVPVVTAGDASQGLAAPSLALAGAESAIPAAGAAPSLPGTAAQSADPTLGPVAEGGLAVVPAEAASLVGGNQGAGEALFALPAAGAAGAAVPRLEPASASLPTPTPVVNTARGDWPEQLSSQISWHLGREVQEARIALAPDDLGAIDLQVRVQDGRVQVHMGAAQATTRELLSEALPRLRELLGDSGLSLSQASVFSQDPQSRGYAPPAWQTDRGTGSTEPERIEAPSLPPPRRLRGLFDHYA